MHESRQRKFQKKDFNSIKSINHFRHMLFSAALDEGEWKIIMTRPQESASGAGLLAPFHEIVWYLILVSLIVVGPVIYSLLVVYKRFTRDPEQQFYNLPKCVWFVYGEENCDFNFLRRFFNAIFNRRSNETRINPLADR
jgi:hypothetical protein